MSSRMFYGRPDDASRESRGATPDGNVARGLVEPAEEDSRTGSKRNPVKNDAGRTAVLQMGCKTILLDLDSGNFSGSGSERFAVSEDHADSAVFPASCGGHAVEHVDAYGDGPFDDEFAPVAVPGEDAARSQPRAAAATGGLPQSNANSKSPGYKECKAKLLKLVSMRDFTVLTMRNKLSAYGFAESDVDACIEYGQSMGFLDDARFAESYIAAKKELGWGRERIERSLEEKGVNCSDLSGYPDALFPEEDELERARKCLMGHRTKAKNARDAHYRFLLSKGFSSYVAARVLRECKGELDY